MSSEIKVCIHGTTRKLTVYAGLLFSRDSDGTCCSEDAVPISPVLKKAARAAVVDDSGDADTDLEAYRLHPKPHFKQISST